jgi:hypothetical protein
MNLVCDRFNRSETEEIPEITQNIYEKIYVTEVVFQTSVKKVKVLDKGGKLVAPYLNTYANSRGINDLNV